MLHELVAQFDDSFAFGRRHLPWIESRTVFRRERLLRREELLIIMSIAHRVPQIFLLGDYL